MWICCVCVIESDIGNRERERESKMIAIDWESLSVLFWWVVWWARLLIYKSIYPRNSGISHRSADSSARCWIGSDTSPSAWRRSWCSHAHSTRSHSCRDADTGDLWWPSSRWARSPDSTVLCTATAVVAANEEIAEYKLNMSKYK